MSCEIVVLPEFARQIKRLAKRYRLIKKDLAHLSAALKSDPHCGTHLLGNCYKVRLANSSVPVGKSGGFRVIYYYRDDRNGRIYLLAIYSKSDQATISEEEIIAILRRNALG